MLHYIKANPAAWLQDYMADKKNEPSGMAASMKLCRRFAGICRYLQFFCTKPYSNLKIPAGYEPRESSVHFYMPLTRSWAEMRRRGSARVKNLKKHSGRLTALITVQADDTIFLHFTYNRELLL
ncbi:hypothetical protein PHYSODRAFT_503899 [Phytophthora sojae]|uniref:Uncharacterized protein n=1 Tax=Phytophthora sojae (strain P6497) TaxID=1094619 RepID=G4ZD37_PHYSP|nr:hypothetical protein PHYSODRAFT_503899 [Phytophthora sojae]EGZ16445.1 hypothetical protein PHYSODRAFT_503899 [Phytophthora sojae]|eukprot:XP_009525503.1 hypothetical protein PHYSODRAFT_503899 [Phytophthora sojae]